MYQTHHTKIIQHIGLAFLWISLTFIAILLHQWWVEHPQDMHHTNTTHAPLTAIMQADTTPPQHNPRAHFLSKEPALQYRSDIKEVVLDSNHYGHYTSNGFINEHEVLFLLDTGSTQVAIPGKLADDMGLSYGKKQATGTANGTIWVYSTTLESLRIGNIELKNVAASINPYMTESEILLGMSVLKQLDFYQTGGKLRLQQL